MQPFQIKAAPISKKERAPTRIVTPPLWNFTVTHTNLNGLSEFCILLYHDSFLMSSIKVGAHAVDYCVSS